MSICLDGPDIIEGSNSHNAFHGDRPEPATSGAAKGRGTLTIDFGNILDTGGQDVDMDDNEHDSNSSNREDVLSSLRDKLLLGPRFSGMTNMQSGMDSRPGVSTPAHHSSAHSSQGVEYRGPETTSSGSESDSGDGSSDFAIEPPATYLPRSPSPVEDKELSYMGESYTSCRIINTTLLTTASARGSSGRPRLLG